MRASPYVIALALAQTTATAAPEVEVDIGVVQAQLRYDKTSFNAMPGAKVAITFKNDDELQHNLIVCRGGEGAWKTVADAALKLGAAGFDKGWLPESDLIVAATRMLNPHEEQTIRFTAPEAEGIYPFVCTFPGHAQIMRGEMVVSRYPRGLGDLRYRYYEGKWIKLPDFSKLQPAATGKIEDNKITLAPRKRHDEFGFVFEGSLNVPVDGEYQFSTSSDDGSRLLVDGNVVVDNDGVHGNRSRAGKVQLKQGAHRLEVQYFEGGGGETLEVFWAGPGFKTEPLSAGAAANSVDAGEFFPPVPGRATVVRVRLPSASARSMAVGLPGGISFCFDAETCSVRYAWNGGFVDVSPERGNGKGRGGGVCKVVGENWKVGDTGTPLLRFGEGDPAPRFAGYRIDGDAVEMHYQIGARSVRQRVEATPAGDGLEYTFSVAGGGPQPKVEIKRDEVEVEGSGLKFTVRRKL